MSNSKNNATRALNNLTSFIGRDVTGWVKDRNARWQYESAYFAVCLYEDEVGIDEAAKLADRLLALRWRAQDTGLLDYTDIRLAEDSAINRLDRR